jgi:hypothetical protein
LSASDWGRNRSRAARDHYRDDLARGSDQVGEEIEEALETGCRKPVPPSSKPLLAAAPRIPLPTGECRQPGGNGTKGDVFQPRSAGPADSVFLGHKTGLAPEPSVR